MPTRRLAALLLAATAAFTACGSSDDATPVVDPGVSSGNVDDEVVAVGAAPLPVDPAAAVPDDGVGGIGDAVKVAAAAPGDAADAACTIDRQTLQLAVQTYEVLNGAMPTSQQDLIDAQMIRELSVRFEVGANGAVVPALGSACT